MGVGHHPHCPKLWPDGLGLADPRGSSTGSGHLMAIGLSNP